MAVKEPDRPLGKRFTQNYVEKGERQPDSRKARNRIAALISELAFSSRTPTNTYDYLRTILIRELGEKIDRFDIFLNKCTLDEFLDTITVISQNISGVKTTFIREADRILNEEHLTYRVDNEGGVHPFVDPEFSRASAATIATLSSARYATALQHFEEAMELLGGANSRSKAAIREVFLALETLFKLVAPGSPSKLATKEIENFRGFALL
jgi:hypothetical protein